MCIIACPTMYTLRTYFFTLGISQPNVTECVEKIKL